MAELQKCDILERISAAWEVIATLPCLEMIYLRWTMRWTSSPHCLRPIYWEGQFQRCLLASNQHCKPMHQEFLSGLPSCPGPMLLNDRVWIGTGVSNMAGPLTWNKFTEVKRNFRIQSKFLTILKQTRRKNPVTVQQLKCSGCWSLHFSVSR